jgi:hypothetical protein
MEKKPPGEKDTLRGFSRVTESSPPADDDSSAAKPPPKSISGRPVDPTELPRAQGNDSGSLIDAHDGWTVERRKRGSSDPPPRTTSRPHATPSEQRRDSCTLRGIPTPASQTAIPIIKSDGGALDLADRSRSSQMALNLREEMEELYTLGEFTGSLRIAELILGSRPDDKQARLCAQNSSLRLVEQYSSKIGPLTQVPKIALSDAEIRWLGLDHREGFVLSQIDGQSSVEELVDICGMSRLELFKTLIELLNRGAIHLER